MRRREFITLLGGAATWPLASRAQQSVMPAIGLLHPGSQGAFGHVVEGFRRGLAESDLLEGRNVIVEYRWADGRLDRLPFLAADLVRREVAVIIGGDPAALAAKDATSTIPIIFLAGEDPVKRGWVQSLNRPGGNMTGIYLFAMELEPKRLGLLRDVVPTAKTVAVLVNSNYPTAESQVREAQEAAARLAFQLVIAGANSEGEFDPAFATFVQQQAAALLVCASPLFNNKRDQLVALAARYKLPAMYELPEFTRAGGLMSYGNSIVDIYRQAGVYAARILQGTKPADLPVVQPTKFEFAINLKTAKALGINISDNLLLLADEVVE
jgi:putative ABC transport system substrate-binding protein